MHVFSLLDAAASNPALAWPFDQAAAAHRLAELRLAAGPLLAPLLEDRRARLLLDGIFGNSPFLSHLILREPDFLLSLLRDGPELTMNTLQQQLQALAVEDLPPAKLAWRLRGARGHAALSIALADISGYWELGQVTAALSSFAQTLLQSALDAQLRAHAKSGELELADPQRPSLGCGYVILAMGKLGAFELNYSSDIDLILLFDPERSPYRGKRDLADFQIRFSKSLVRLLQDFTADGQVFRVDLRLRPDPGATPIALPVIAAESYYESAGKSWERAAMIKARPVAGDIELGQTFLRNIRPFIWRKHLDFAAIGDVYDMVKRIRAHHGHAEIQIPGHNIKLGAGGIREIEFFVQTHQLIAGGRDPELRDPTTLGMIEILQRKAQLTAADAGQLRDAYVYLRNLEHRLQMIDDAQTHSLPSAPDGLAHVAAFMGHAQAAELATTTRLHLGRVAEHFQRLLAIGEHARSRTGNGAAAQQAQASTTELTLEFADPGKARAIITTWESFRYRALRTGQAQELLRRLIEKILRAIAATSDPDTALARFDEFLSALPAGVQLLALFNANPKLLELLAEIMGTAPRLADALARKPALLDAVLSAEFFNAVPGPEALLADLENALRQARDFQDILDLARAWANDRKFQTGVQLLKNLIDGGGAGRALSDIADAIIRALLPRVEAEVALKHGRIPDAAMAVLAMGKLGGRELTFTSDLDLIFIYPETAQHSDGKSPLAAAPYFARLSQRFINALTALTPEGRLYEVDMRLRPSGGQGPIAVSFDSFKKYQTDAAQTWEHLAMTRARPVTGPEPLCVEIATAMREFLARPRHPAQLVRDVDAMRQRIEREHHTSNIWDFKYSRGGMIDAEFIIQYLILRHASQTPQLITGNTIEAINALRLAGAVNERQAATLRTAVILQRDAQQLTRLCLQQGFDATTAPPALCKLMAAQAGAKNFEQLAERLRTSQVNVYTLYREMIPEAESPTGK